MSEVRKVFLNNGQRPPLWFWRDRQGLEVDLLMDLGTSRVPVEVKSGHTVASDAFRSLAKFARLSGDAGGMLFYGGDESHTRSGYQVRAWWTASSQSRLFPAPFRGYRRPRLQSGQRSRGYRRPRLHQATMSAP